MTTVKKATPPRKVVKKTPTPLQLHVNGQCGCTELINLNSCVYQPFLDGWDFTPDVGNGQKRGEIFTPRFIVDHMIVDSGLLPRKAVYDYDYAGSYDYLRKYVDKRVFEPAVGTGNFSATILWHKMCLVNELTKPKGAVRTDAELSKYQSYTLVALSSVFVNDIDAGNLQATKTRMLRDSEINTDVNIQFWVNQVLSNLSNPDDVDRNDLTSMVTGSIKTASDNWGTFDEDKGVMDVLYKKHTGVNPPDWLKTAWKNILDTNSQLFNGIVLEDTVEEGFICPGYKNVAWTFYRFKHTKNEIVASQYVIPLMRQISEGKIRALSTQLERLKAHSNVDYTVLDIFQDENNIAFENPDQTKEFNLLNKKLARLQKDAEELPEFQILDDVHYLRQSDDEN